MAPAPRCPKLVDEDPAEPSLADGIGTRPQILGDPAENGQDPTGGPAVVGREEPNVVAAHGAD